MKKQKNTTITSIQSDNREIQPKNFITVWDTTKTGKKASRPRFRLPLDKNGSYNFTV